MSGVLEDICGCSGRGLKDSLFQWEMIRLIGRIAVHICVRVIANARGGEILVTNAVKDMVADSDIRFQSRETHDLKGEFLENGIC